MMELLSPAGSPEALRAAVQNGADAVYLGWGSFNARQSAFKTATDGMRLILGTCPDINAAELSQAVNIVGIEEKLRGLIDDMDAVSAKLRDIFKK